jgi:hypothetical protein
LTLNLNSSKITFNSFTNGRTISYGLKVIKWL